MTRKALLLRIQHYLDTSWDYDEGLASTCLYWVSPSGRSKSKHFYASGYWSNWQAEQWLKAKYRPRLSNLFGLMFYV